ncbi:hypothetical protein OE88DRAFT_327325 [Heliocybe sulcata]|uniref:Uncharacterized protein n=1 Tax=Heliocybe sulcata TaxID=5364 RepID=A0A5C3MZ48_9AGAM|nr:hypothetical protein OE88DRAFT_327325 [Heliocybe sulcata]
MNSFWTFLDNYVFARLPSIRIVSDDLESSDSESSSSYYAARSIKKRRPSLRSPSYSNIATNNSPARSQRADRDRDLELGENTELLQRTPPRQRRESDRQQRDEARELREQERQQRERARERERQEAMEREQEREREVQRLRARLVEYDRDREKDRILIQSLQTENASLQSKVATIQSSLSNAVSQLSAITTKHSALQTVHASLQAKYAALQSQPQSPAPSPISPPVELRALHDKYDGLKGAYGQAITELKEKKEEVKSLQTFLNRTDEWSGAQIVQSIKDLNGEIVQLAALIADEFCFPVSSDTSSRGLDIPRPRSRLPSHSKSIPSSGSLRSLLSPSHQLSEAVPSHYLMRASFPPALLDLLQTHAADPEPTFVQFVIQAWLVQCCSIIFDSFCFGLRPELDVSLRHLWDTVKKNELQATASRWRSLTYMYCRPLASRSVDGPGSSSLGLSQAADPQSALTSMFMDGLQSLLTLSVSSAETPVNSVSGLTTPSASPARSSPISRLTSPAPTLPDAPTTRFLQPSVELLAERHNTAVCRIFERAIKTSEVLKTGVMSAWFDPVSIGPMTRETSLSLWYDYRSKSSRPRRDSSASSQAYAGGSTSRSLKDALMTWNSDQSRFTFNPNVMENMYNGASAAAPVKGEQKDLERDQKVLCTVELGLVCVRRESVAAEVNGSETSLKGEDPKPGETMSRNLLVKPKVLLESVRDIL